MTHQEDLDLARRARAGAEYADAERTQDWLATWLPNLASPLRSTDEALIYSALSGLASARGLAAAAERLEHYYAAQLRERDISWTSIGIAADITRQSAQQRYGRQ